MRQGCLTHQEGQWAALSFITKETQIRNKPESRLIFIKLRDGLFPYLNQNILRRDVWNGVSKPQERPHVATACSLPITTLPCWVGSLFYKSHGAPSQQGSPQANPQSQAGSDLQPVEGRAFPDEYGKRNQKSIVHFASEKISAFLLCIFSVGN